MVDISIDTMGGDQGVELTLAGAELARQRFAGIRFLFFGLESAVLPVLARYPALQAASSFYPCETVTAMDEKPSQALRSGKGKSSMWHAIEAVAKGDAHACVSAGNTGALMAMSYFILKMIASIERPAIAGIWPTLRSESIVLDIGASIGAQADHLVDLAVMGAAMFRALYSVQQPTVGLLNVGVEEVKGLDEIKKAHNMLKENRLGGLEYKGFVEGNDIGKGAVDVVVTEGFVGNIALKTAEGTAQQIRSILNEAMQASLLTRLGYILSKSAFGVLRAKMDPSKVNGGVLLGLNGIVVKSHGYTTPAGFASAIRVAYEMVNNNLQEKIAQDLYEFHENKYSLAGE
ncbi:phosphate acyltransferase PlsX [Bartonella sp. TP]|uniref:phosphate acyltransferase PlsX n=1 Tax=Bartonella sp. TP TaxID=3057550 RepID=UPI0025B23961|nr:phosphate acyltransferase PlsX [Bartonella sp. TP]MDN5248753.1 phosphate acyltransferase PlsX [Alphaproteobacteria bacterium]WJW80010.1 phosphate acyltransferase PlsX [Bartonella sp. TP]